MPPRVWPPPTPAPSRRTTELADTGAIDAAEPLSTAPKGPATVATPKPVGTLVRPNDFGNQLAAGGAQSIALRSQAQLDSLEKTGIGHYYGAKSGFHSMTPADQADFLQKNLKPGQTAPTVHEGSCISWVFENVGASYRAAGQEERWKAIIKEVGAKGSKGTDLAKEL